MKSTELSALAATLRTNIAAARLTRRNQALSDLAGNVEAALAQWTLAHAKVRALRDLNVDYEDIRAELDLLRKPVHDSAHGLVLATEDELANSQPSRFRRTELQNASRVITLADTRWRSWAETFATPVAWLPEVINRLPKLSELAPMLASFHSGKLAAAPSDESGIAAAKKWIDQREVILKRLQALLPPHVASFLRQAASEPIWLENIEPTSLTWMLENGLGRFLQVIFTKTANPAASPQPKPKAAQTAPQAIKDDEGWD